jgi:D-xylulose reductase
MSLEDGAMIEPLAVGVHSVSTLAQVKSNQTVAVFGAGPVGLLCMAVAKACGAKRVIAIDIAEERLKFAQSYAATDGFMPPKLNEGEERMAYSQRATNELMKALKLEERGSNAVDVVIDASGAEVCIQMGLFLVTAGGTYVQVGMGASEVKVPITLLLTKELVVKGSFRYGPGAYELAIALVAAGKVDLKPLVTHRYSFTDAEKAFKTTRSGKSEDGKGVIKVIISGPE